MAILRLVHPQQDRTAAVVQHFHCLADPQAHILHAAVAIAAAVAVPASLIVTIFRFSPAFKSPRGIICLFLPLYSRF